MIHRAFLFGLCLYAVRVWALPDHITVPATNPWTQQVVTFSLDRYNLRATNYQVRIYSDATTFTVVPPVQLPEVTTYRGRIAADPGAMVVGSFSTNGDFVYAVTYGCREVNQEAMDPYDTTNRLMWGGWGTSVPTTNIFSPGYAYSWQTNMPSTIARSTNNYPVNTTNYGGPTSFNSLHKVPVQRVRLIQDMSRECFINSCSSNVNYTIMMQESRVNEMDYIEARDFGISYQIVCICIRPYTDAPFTSVGNGRLGDLRNYWQADPGWAGDHGENANAWFDMAQGTMNLGGGVAFAPGDFCITDPGFNGNVQGHETAHNWGAGDVTSQWDYTGENYWHWAETGSGYGHSTEMVNRVIGIRRYGEYYKSAGYMEWVKYNSPVAPWATPDLAITTTNQPVTVNVLLNDYCVNSNALSVVSFETNTPAGGLVISLGDGILQYTPPAGFAGYDWFHYYVGEGTGLKSLSEVHVQVSDPGNALLGQWNFDQTNGTTLAEATGRGVAGSLKGTASFVTGSAPGLNNSGALHFDGNGHVQFPGRWFDPLNGSWALSVWCRPDATPASDQAIFSKTDRSGANGLFLGMNSSSIYLNGATFGIASGFSVVASVVPEAGKWHHVVASVDRTNHLARLWVNGVEHTGTWNTRSIPATEFIFGEAPPTLGGCPGRSYNLSGSLDDVRLYSKALTQAEVSSLYVAGGILPATLSSPHDGELNVSLRPALTWSAGRTAYQHDVFLGTNCSAVLSATTNSAEYKGRVDQTNYTPAVTLLTNQTYYWRVDEVENGTNFAKSAVWSFVTAVDAIHGGLKLHLTLDARDTVGTNTFDRSGPPFKNGSLCNNPALAPGRVNEGMNFSGTGSYIGLGNPDDLNFAGQITISAWVKPGATDGLRNILEHGYHLYPHQEVGLRINSGYYEILSWDGNNHGCRYAIPAGDLNTWVHLVGEHDGTNWRLFRNGVQVAQVADPVGSILVSDNWAVGARGTGTERFFQGSIDDVMIWNRPLGTGEIAAIYANGLAGLSIDGARPVAPDATGFTWVGRTDSYWTTAANWFANAVPGAADTVIFNDRASGSLGTVLGTGLSVGGVAIGGGMAGIDIGGPDTLTLGSGGIVMSNDYPYTVATVSAPVTLGASQTWTVGSNGTLNVGGTLSLGNATLTLNNNSALILSGAVSGSGKLVVRGSHWTTFAEANPSAGGTTVNGGSLEVLTSGSDGLYILTNRCMLRIAYSTGGGYANTPMKIYGDGAPAATGFYLKGGCNYNSSGQIQLLGGPTTIRQYGAGLAGIGTFDIWGDGLWCSAAASGSVMDANVQMISCGYGMSAQIDAGASTATGDLVLNGPLNVGNLGFYKRGGGSMRLNASAFVGNAALQLVGGTVICGAFDCIGAGASLSMSGGTTLDLNGFSQIVANASLGGTLKMSINKGATPSSTVLNVAGGSSLTFGGGLVVSNPSGALALDDTFTLFTAPGYTGTFSSLTLPALPLGLAWDTSKLAVNGSITVVIPPTLTWDANTTITGAQDGTGTWNLTAINWWNGAGDVAWSDGSYASFGVDTPANRTVTLASDMAPAGILFNATGGGTYTLASGGGNIVLSGAPRVTNVANATISAVLKGSGSVSKAGAGTLTLTGNNTYSGDTTIDGGTLVLNASSSTYVYSGGPISINNASTLRLAGSRYDFSGKTFTFDSNGGGTIDTSSGLNFVSWSPGNTFATAGGAQNLIIGTSGMNINSGVVNTFNVMRGTGVSDLKVTTYIWNTGGILKTGNGILELTGANTYTGATTVTNGTLLMNGSQASGSAINVTNATLAGTGSVGGTVTIRNGATIAPGANGVGTLATGAEIWYGGGSYLCEINGTNANSSDRLNISGQLNVQATPGNPFIIKLVSLSEANAPGPIPNFDKFTSYSWTNAIATSSANLAESRFVLDTSSISNGFGGGTFSLAVSGNSLVVKYTRALLPPVWGGYGPLNGHSFPLVFGGPSGQTYKVLSTTNVSLPMASWATLATGTFGVSPVTYTDATATNDARFYRIVSP